MAKLEIACAKDPTPFQSLDRQMPRQRNDARASMAIAARTLNGTFQMSELSTLVMLHVAARTARCGVGQRCCTALRRDRYGISIRAISLLKLRLIHHIAGAPTGTVSL